MPMYRPKGKVKVVCNKCGYEFYTEVGGYGDLIGRNPQENMNFLRDFLNAIELRCPKCKAVIKKSEPEEDVS